MSEKPFRVVCSLLTQPAAIQLFACHFHTQAEALAFAVARRVDAAVTPVAGPCHPGLLAHAVYDDRQTPPFLVKGRALTETDDKLYTSLGRCASVDQLANATATAKKERGRGRPPAVDATTLELIERRLAAGDKPAAIANDLEGVSRTTVYRIRTELAKKKNQPATK